MKLSKKFVIYNSSRDSLLVPSGKAKFAGLVRGNKTLGALLALLKTDTDEAAIIKALCARFDAPEPVIAADVKKVLAELSAIGALEE